MLALQFLGTSTSEGVWEEISPLVAVALVPDAHKHAPRQAGCALGPPGLQPHPRLRQYVPRGWQI